MLDVPWAMFPKGPPWTNAGVPSIVWTRFGLIAFFRRTAIAPTALRSDAVTGSPFELKPTIMRPSLALSSA